MLDALNDLLLIALLPSLVMLAGASIVLGSYWPVMCLIVAMGSLILYWRHSRAFDGLRVTCG